MLSFLRSFCYTSACCSNAAPIRASSSAGQSWRLITAWSRVQVLPGPPKKHEGFGLRAFLFPIRTYPYTVLCSSVSESLCAACHRPACRLQGWYWAARVRLLRLPLPRRSSGWTTGCSQKCAGTYEDESSRFQLSCLPCSPVRRSYPG